MLIQCEETIKDVATLYIDGDKSVPLRHHQVPVFTDEKLRALQVFYYNFFPKLCANECILACTKITLQKKTRACTGPSLQTGVES